MIIVILETMRAIPSFLLCCLACTILACSQSTDDPQQLETIVVQWFDGIKNRDLNKLNALTTKDFKLYENGMIWTNDSLIILDNVQRSWTLSDVTIHMDENSGDMTYQNYGRFRLADSTILEKHWLESATFRKVDGVWKLHFLHSTRVGE